MSVAPKWASDKKTSIFSSPPSATCFYRNSRIKRLLINGCRLETLKRLLIMDAASLLIPRSAKASTVTWATSGRNACDGKPTVRACCLTRGRGWGRQVGGGQWVWAQPL